MTGIERAVQILAEKENRPTEGDAVLAAHLNVNRQAVFGWRHQGFAPVGRVRVISELTGVPVKELCAPEVAGLFE